MLQWPVITVQGIRYPPVSLIGCHCDIYFYVIRHLFNYYRYCIQWVFTKLAYRKGRKLTLKSVILFNASNASTVNG
jgi:hypothetical protein